MSTPQLSIVLPVYNVDRWIGQCLSSIQAQTFTDWEAILVDDGSRDFSGVICDNFSRRDPRFKVIHQRNSGVSAARNAGIAAATAPLLSFIDPDDFISENYFSCLVGDLMAANAECAVSTFQCVLENGEEGIFKFLNKLEAKGRSNINHIMRTNEEVIDAICTNLFSCVSWGKVFTRELWGDARFPVGVDLGEDMMTVPPVIIRAKSAVCVPEARYFYRQRERSLLHGTVSRKRYLKDLAASSAMLDQLCAHSPEKRDGFQMLKLQYDFGCLANYLGTNPEKAHGRSKLSILAQGIKDSGSADVLAAVLKRLVE